jgi:hypothetical protein
MEKDKELYQTEKWKVLCKHNINTDPIAHLEDSVTVKCALDAMEEYAQLRLSEDSRANVLPTEEEIEKRINKINGDGFMDHMGQIKGFRDCLKWMRDRLSLNSQENTNDNTNK